MRRVVTAMLIVVAIIHWLPLAGVLGGERLAALYDVAIDDRNLEILLRHRAVLFGLFGAFLLHAAIRPSLQPLAFVAGFVSVVSFLVLGGLAGEANAALRRVFVADGIALVCLAVGLVAFWIDARRN